MNKALFDGSFSRCLAVELRDPRQHVLTRRRVPVGLVDVGNDDVRQLLGIGAREGLLAAGAAQRELGHAASVARRDNLHPSASSRSSRWYAA